MMGSGGVEYHLSQPTPSARLSWYRADSLASSLEVQEDREDWRLAEINTREQAEIIEEIMRNNSCEWVIIFKVQRSIIIFREALK